MDKIILEPQKLVGPREGTIAILIKKPKGFRSEISRNCKRKRTSEVKFRGNKIEIETRRRRARIREKEFPKTVQRAARLKYLVFFRIK
jgi:hypothetical protein